MREIYLHFGANGAILRSNMPVMGEICFDNFIDVFMPYEIRIYYKTNKFNTIDPL